MRVLYVNMVVMSRQNILFPRLARSDVAHTRALIGRVASLHESIVCRVVMVVCKLGWNLVVFWRQTVVFAVRIWKGFEWKTSTSLLYLPISSSAVTWKIFRNMLCHFLFVWADILSETKPVFWIRVQALCTRFRESLVRICLLISALNQSFAFFLGKVVL